MNLNFELFINKIMIIILLLLAKIADSRDMDLIE